MCRWWANYSEPTIFLVLILATLAPVWAFHYLPTQDGPSHLSNAQIIKDIGDSSKHYGDVFELRGRPLPNLASHYLLAGLLFVVPPLIAEKLVATLYIVGFAYSYRYFLGSLDQRALPLSWAGLLLVYSRCFWMGFFNYCLGMTFVWVVAGLVIRNRSQLGVKQVVTLLAFFTAAYFTHLAASLIALVAACGAALWFANNRILTTLKILAAAAPSLILTAIYFHDAGLPDSRRAALRLDFIADLVQVDGELYAHHVGSNSPGVAVLVFLLGLMTTLDVVESRSAPSSPEQFKRRGYVATLTLTFTLLYLLVPQDLGDHGGFLKTRLAPLIFLAWLACLRESNHWEIRWFVRGLIVTLLTLNLVCTIATMATGNLQITQYLAGIRAVGSSQRIFVTQPNQRPTPLVNPLLHAANYYCLGTDNLNLDNYEAELNHFPVRFRAGVRRGHGRFQGYSNANIVDVVLIWHSTGADQPRPPDGWIEVFHEGSLRIVRRP